MTPNERAELRRLAEAACPYCSFFLPAGFFSFFAFGASSSASSSPSASSAAPSGGGPYRECRDEALIGDIWARTPSAETARYLAALSPERVVALLDRLDAAEATVADLDVCWQAAARDKIAMLEAQVAALKADGAQRGLDWRNA